MVLIPNLSLSTGEDCNLQAFEEYEDLLSAYDFFRIHKSFLVNLQEIKKYIRGEGGQLIMSNGAALNVSKQRKEDFLNIYSGS
jgi:two-component system LytT family response regulator